MAHGIVAAGLNDQATKGEDDRGALNQAFLPAFDRHLRCALAQQTQRIGHPRERSPSPPISYAFEEPAKNGNKRQVKNRYADILEVVRGSRGIHATTQY